MDYSTRQSFFEPIFMTRDNLGVWGAPWEGQRRGSYTVLRKGGGLGGFSSFISFVPELKLGLVVLANSDTAAPEDITYDSWTTLIPYFEEHSPVSPLIAPGPEDFVGTWVSADGLSWNISRDSDQRLIFIPPPYYYNGPGYIIPSPFPVAGWAQTFHPDSSLPCFRNLMGLNFNWIEVKTTTPVPTLSLPFFFPDRVFYKFAARV